MRWKARCISVLCECLHAFWFQAGNVLWCVWPGQTQEVLNLLKLKNKPKIFGTSQNTHVVPEGEGLDSFLIWHEHHTSGKHSDWVILQKGYTLAFSLRTVSKALHVQGLSWGISWNLLSSFDPFLFGCHSNLCFCGQFLGSLTWTCWSRTGSTLSQEPVEAALFLSPHLDESGLQWALGEPPI